MQKGDIVLIPFPFTNLKETKKRPAVVLYTNKQDVIVAFITSRLKWSNSFDVNLYHLHFEFTV
jgi:mRNA interferase MazF